MISCLHNFVMTASSQPPAMLTVDDPQGNPRTQRVIRQAVLNDDEWSNEDRELSAASTTKCISTLAHVTQKMKPVQVVETTQHYYTVRWFITSGCFAASSSHV